MSERKNSLVPTDPETPVAVADPLAEATGARDPEVAARLAQQVISVLSLVLRFQRLFPTVNLFDDGAGGCRPDKGLGVGVVVFEIIFDRPLEVA